ncbi:trypco2 family protein [Streptomyces sp. NPDC050658]|uniref:trypco2 family protein n=1 Tax=unclassified Streptomyces TaxID=2593676 RepID=UPI0034258618
MADEAWAGLAEAIGAIREELREAAEAGRGKGIQFRTGPVELEFTVDVKKDVEGRVKAMVLPFGAEAKAGRSSGVTNRIKVTLQPVDPETGEDSRIGERGLDERPR